MKWCLPVLLGLVLLGGVYAAAEPVPADVQARFLRDRDVRRLLQTLERPGAQPPAPALALARLAAGREAAQLPEGPGPEGAEGLAPLVQALRARDLDEARRRAARVERGGGLAGGWLQALVRLRVGDDAGATGRLLAPPFMDWRRDAFLLALVGAALPDDDRRMLAAGGRAALERAAARKRTPAVVATARALAALDPEAGRRAHAFAIDALRRTGEAGQAVSLLAAAPSAGVAPTDPLLALQAALLAWERGDPARIPTLLAGRPPPGTQSVYLALRRAGRHPRLIETGAPVGHEPGARAHAVTAARLVTALGGTVSAAEVEAWCRKTGREVHHAGTLRAFLESRRYRVLSVAGDSAAADAMLAAGLPFVLLRLANGDDGYRDTPALVKAYDSATGLWLLDEPDVRLFDVVPHDIAAKSRLLCAVPQVRGNLLAPYASSRAATVGRLLESALDLADRGDDAAGLARLDAERGAGGIVDLYRALLLRRLGDRLPSADRWQRIRAAVERSRSVAPRLPFEERALGEALAAQGRADDALVAFDHVAYLEGDGVDLALARFAIDHARGDRSGARAALEAAVRVAPLDVRALYHRASIQVELDDPEGARVSLRRGLARRPSEVRFAVALSRLELAAGRPQKALDLLADIERRSRDLEGDPVLQLARRDAERALIEAAETVAELRPLARSRDATTRRRLAFELARRSGDADAVEPLLRTLLSDADADVRATTLRLYMRPWLRERIDADAVLARRVTALLQQDPEAGVRRAAADLLGRVRAPLSCRALSAVLGGAERDADAGVRGAAARALGGHALEACRGVLVDALEDPDLGVRKAAAQTLFELSGMTHGYEADDAPEKRAAAVEKWRAWLAEG